MCSIRENRTHREGPMTSFQLAYTASPKTHRFNRTVSAYVNQSESAERLSGPSQQELSAACLHQ